jgi:hypothetical protein
METGLLTLLCYPLTLLSLWRRLLSLYLLRGLYAKYSALKTNTSVSNHNPTASATSLGMLVCLNDCKSLCYLSLLSRALL